MNPFGFGYRILDVFGDRSGLFSEIYRAPFQNVATELWPGPPSLDASQSIWHMPLFHVVTVFVMFPCYMDLQPSCPGYSRPVKAND